MSAGHTPGPWRVRVNAGDDVDRCDLTICGDTWQLADLNGPQYEHQHPNACLMASAPDLLALAYQYRNDLRYPPQGDSIERRLTAIDAAIAKATNTHDANDCGASAPFQVRA